MTDETLHRVAITGLGTVSAAGCGRRLLAAALAGSTTAASEIEPFPTATRVRGEARGEARGGGRRAHLASLVPRTELAALLPPREARRLSPPSRYAVAAARLAMEDAGLEAGEVEGTGTAVVLATAFGPGSYSERILLQILDDGPQGVSPALFTESVANAPAARVALALSARGANLTITQREAGPLLALAAAAREVASGRSRVALAGAVDELNPLLHHILDRFGALAHDGDGRPERPRPFDRRRNGMLAAEGASIAVLEREDSARARGAAILARYRLGAAGFDPSAPATGWSRRPETLAATLSARLDRAGIAPASIDRVVSGASGTRGGDRLEAGVLERVFGREALPPVLAPKAVTGEYGGGFLASAVLAAAGAVFGPTAGFEETDPELGLTPYDGRPLPPTERLLVSSLAVGGAAAWAVLEAGDR